MTLDTAVRTRPATDDARTDNAWTDDAQTDDVDALVAAARRDDSAAWARLITRYSPLVTGVARRYRLSAADVDDVAQIVWMRCYQNLHALRDARALPGWLRTTTQHEALRFLNCGNRSDAMYRDLSDQLVDTGRTECPDVAADLLREEAIRTIRGGLDELTPKERRLLQLLHASSRPSYTEISDDLGIPRGSIGPSRARYLAKLRHTSAVARYLDQDDMTLGA